eukprot:jgi/Tetstr1/466066/TSEL_010653.t1
MSLPEKRLSSALLLPAQQLFPLVVAVNFHPLNLGELPLSASRTVHRGIMSALVKPRLKDAKYLEFLEVRDPRLLVIKCISVNRYIRHIPGYRDIFTNDDTTVDDAHHN